MTQPAPQRIDIAIAPAEAGKRLDRVLAGHVEALSRSRLQGLIRAGAVTAGDAVGGSVAVTDPGRKVRAGERYALALPEPEPAKPAAEAIALAVVYEDAHMIVIDKPAGLVVHPAAGHASGTLVNALIAHCGESLSGIGGVRRPGIVHRLDKDTSGLLVVAKTDAAHKGLADQFRTHGADGRLERRYRALVWGQPQHPKGSIDAPLGRSRSNRARIAVVRGGNGRRAVTHYEVLERFTGPDGKVVASLVELVLETGRTHQIRVHLAHIGHPVMGDPVYGASFRASAARLGPEAQQQLARLDRQALHAASLQLEHPIGGRRHAFESPLPAAMAGLLLSLRSPSPKVAVRSRARGRATESTRRTR
jgi:23S rRNA pseudouridine1911/1915/1917 synthase